MHPAYSVILFTTASGAGYGLLAMLGLAAAFGLGMPQAWSIAGGATTPPKRVSFANASSR